MITQSRDPKIKALRTRLEVTQVPGFVMRDGLVFRVTADHRELFYVPTEMEDNVIRLAHETVGHQGYEKTRLCLRNNYWMPDMKRRIETHIHNCVPCIMYSSPVQAGTGGIHCIPKAAVPFDTYHIDHFGPLPAVQSKRKHMLVVIDAFTKFIRLYPTNSTSTKEVNCALTKHFENYSRPRRIISDRGSCFTSTEFAELITKNNITHVKNATASPAANGQVERSNRVIKAMLGKLTEPVQHADWTKILGHAEHAINNSVHSTTGRTPAEMLFGVSQRGAVVNRLSEYLEEKKGAPVRNLELIRQAADARIKASQQYITIRHSSKHKPAKTYCVGDYVVIRNTDNTPGVNKKFEATFRGPYVVAKVLGNDRYVIQDIEGCQRTQIPYDGVLESSRIRKWVEMDETLNDYDIPDDCPYLSLPDSRAQDESPPARPRTNAAEDDPKETQETPQCHTSGGKEEGKEKSTRTRDPDDQEQTRRILRPLPHRAARPGQN